MIRDLARKPNFPNPGATSSTRSPGLQARIAPDPAPQGGRDALKWSRWLTRECFEAMPEQVAKRPPSAPGAILVAPFRTGTERTKKVDSVNAVLERDLVEITGKPFR